MTLVRRKLAHTIVPPVDHAARKRELYCVYASFCHSQGVELAPVVLATKVVAFKDQGPMTAVENPIP
jgi:hypothetical protein